jgi:hypothetical protein
MRAASFRPSDFGTIQTMSLSEEKMEGNYTESGSGPGSETGHRKLKDTPQMARNLQGEGQARYDG